MSVANLTKKLLVQARGKNQSSPLNFCFFPKGQGGTIFVSPRMPTKDEIEETREKNGGGKELIGKCFGDGNGNTVFKPKGRVQDKEKLEVQLCKAAKDIGAKIKVIVSLAKPGEKDDEETSASSAVMPKAKPEDEAEGDSTPEASADAAAAAGGAAAGGGAGGAGGAPRSRPRMAASGRPQATRR